jgi:hypothetical protein
MRHLTGSGKVRDRFDNATFCFVTYSERDFPEPLRPAFTRILEAKRETNNSRDRRRRIESGPGKHVREWIEL